MAYFVFDGTGKKLLGVLPSSLRAVKMALEHTSLAGSRDAVITQAELEVFLDGLACINGSQYQEVGTLGEPSNVIIWNIEISTDRDILVRSK